jgi:Tfp pilus assembly protein PilP
MKPHRVPGVVLAALLAAVMLLAMPPAVLRAQAPAPAPAKPASAPGKAAQPAASAAEPQRPAGAEADAQPANAGAGLPQPENYTYNPDGRRDPFVNLIGNGAVGETRAAVRGEGGAAALGIAEISVRGIMQSRGSLVAMVEGPNKKTYIVHPGDKLLDGMIKTITPQGLIVIQEVNDPLSLVKQREVSKLLRSLEGGK